MNSQQPYNIVIVSAVYPPEPVVSARMSFDLANHLTITGNKVTVVCPQPSRPEAADYIKYLSPGTTVITDENGVAVVRLPSFTAPRSGLFARLYESWSFGQHVCNYLAKTNNNPDVMYVNAWPLLAQAHIVYYAKQHNIPVTLQIMDIYPESLLGKLPHLLRYIISLPLLKLDTWIAQQARTVVVISENMRRTYIESRKVSDNRVTTIPTWQDDSLFECVPERSAACQRYNIPDNFFTFLYLGNIGPVAGIDFLIKAFYEATIATAQLVIVGDGSLKADCIKLVSHLNATNIYFISDPEASNVPILQSMAHVFLLPMKCGTGLSSIPSKLPSYLFSAKPVLATVEAESDTARMIHSAECGWVGMPEDLAWLTNKMRDITSMTNDELRELGKNGKAFGLDKFSKAQGVVQLAGEVTPF